MSGGQKAYAGLFLVTLAIYLVMVIWSLPEIAAAAGGQRPFDLRPFGYGYDEARSFLAALDPRGRSFYLAVQHRLDLAYPPLLALTIGLGIRALGPRWLVWPAALGCAAAAGFDWLENIRVAALLRGGADGVTAQMVADASFATVMKSALDAAAMVVLLLLVLWNLPRWLRRSGHG